MGRYCGQCGSPLVPGDRFCGTCGTAQTSTPQPHSEATPAPHPDTGQETALGVIPQVVEVKGLFGKNTIFMNLVVTNQRLIFAHQSEAMWDMMDGEEKKMEAEFEGIGGSWREFIALRDSSTRPWNVYTGMAPDLILAESRGNFEMPVESLEGVEIRLHDDPEDSSLHSSDLVLTTASGERSFDLPWGNGDEAHRILLQVVPSAYLVTAE